MTDRHKRVIAVLGSTGSIGTQTLQVVEEHPECFEVYALTANDRVEELIEQARKFRPEAVVIANEEKYEQLKECLWCCRLRLSPLPMFPPLRPRPRSPQSSSM